ncbi:hypothetical protein T440DRAFT_292720 [Plenodomus tracheiphilus IPT5]|uniref:F-box domain-containing protein n=1 Tax=Plenodomus tracheiphilus IPT5 TaxID=1408161 RepID=A0A6A7BEW0_9PLEO|nr:hypothetical protein T440DRAFT_292720 [Plenodomus tracheiphilus IPT5]
MAPRLKLTTLPPPSTPNRSSSLELGSPSKTTQINKSTGRPIRKSAGKVMKAAGYVDSVVIEEEDFMPFSSDFDDAEEEDDDDDDMMKQSSRSSKAKAKAKAKAKSKRKRSPSPPSPQLEPIIYNQDLEDLTDDETGGAFHRHTPKKPPMTLQFNVPLGFHGPLFVKLDSALVHAGGQGEAHAMQRGRTKKARTEASTPSQRDGGEARAGFADLPPEIRNNIYRYVFVRRGSDFALPITKSSRNFCQSSQFLRTCKLVHQEGCSVLYGENTFHFSRNHTVRSPFWEPVLKEVGYQDMLRFLRMIGPENLQYLRDIKINFDDAAPRHTTYLSSNEARRYLNDEILLHCLRILREAKLRSVKLQFCGRRHVSKSDVKFLGYLEQIKADEVSSFNDWYTPYEKIPPIVWSGVKESMVRKKKLYEKE